MTAGDIILQHTPVIRCPADQPTDQLPLSFPFILNNPSSKHREKDRETKIKDDHVIVLLPTAQFEKERKM